MQDRTIDNALLALRKQIIRGNLDGLEHVEALLILRGVDMPRVMPPKRSDAAKRGHMRWSIRDALRDGPRTLPQLAVYVAGQRPEVLPERTYKRVSVVLTKMQAAGLVRREGRIWQNR